MCEECDRDRDADPWGYYAHRARMRHDPIYRAEVEERRRWYAEAEAEYAERGKDDV